ncbi:hypothetical protein BB777_05320 [Planococcus faecalis]|nr:hypothetical protein BB777_05320 [Planococcus faecalis]
MRRSISRLRTLGHGFRTKPRSALVFVLRLALGAPWLGVVEYFMSLLVLDGVSVGSGCRLAAVVHAPALGVFLLEFVLWVLDFACGRLAGYCGIDSANLFCLG